MDRHDRKIDRAGGLAAAFFAVFVGAPAAPAPASGEGSHTEATSKLLAEARCHCGCGRSAPGNGTEAACFGCSVGKAEITFVLESLAAGRDPREILLALGGLLRVEVFADYDDPALPAVWSQAQRAAETFSLHRVVLRTPARSASGRRALRIAECARGTGQFTRVQAALIAHTGPWDLDTLIGLGARSGLARDTLHACFAASDVDAQIGKDREHARERRLDSLPAVLVNGKRVGPSVEEIATALRRSFVEQGI